MKENRIIILLELLWYLFASLIASMKLFVLTLLGKGHLDGLKENRFLDVLNFMVHMGPRSFWKKPTWIKVGRGISTLLHYTFEKRKSFKEVKKFDK